MTRGDDHRALVDALVAGFNSRDWGRWSAVIRPDASLIVALGLGEDRYDGHEGIRRWFESMPKLWAEFHVEGETIDVDGGRILVQLDTWGIGTRDGIEARRRLFMGLLVDAGMVTAQIVCGDRERALEPPG